MTSSSNADSVPSSRHDFSTVDSAIALRLLQSICLEVSQAANFEAALRRLLELVCVNTEWVFGEIWVPKDGQSLCHSGIWHTARQTLHALGTRSESWCFLRGEGLPGRVWAQRRSEWIANVSEASHVEFQRRDWVIEYGLGAAIAVPVTLADDEVLMVLVFFMDHAEDPDHTQVHLVEAIAAQLGALLRLKHTEAELTQQEQQLQRLLNTLPGIVFTAKGPPHWTMRTLSDGCARLTGYTQQELVTEDSRLSYNDITHPDDLSYVLETIQKALATGTSYEVEYRLITRGGTEKWVWEKGQGVFEASGRAIGLEGFITEITALKATEAALRKSEIRYRMLAERSLDLISQHDLDGEFRYVSPACHNLLGYDAADLIGRSPNELFHREDKPYILRHYRQFLRRRTIPALRFRMRHRNGEYRWFETISCMVAQQTGAGKPQVLAVSRDITERVESEQALIDRERFLKLILDNIPQHLFWKDRNGRYLGCNQTFASGVGFADSEAVIGCTDYDIPAYTTEEARHFRQQDRQVIEAAEPVIDSLEQKVGELPQWISVSKFPIYNTQNQVIGILGSLQDVSDRIAFQASLDRREQYLTALVELQRQLLQFDGQWDNEQFCKLLQPLAMATAANRVYIYEVEAHGSKRLVQRAQWANPETFSTFQDPSVTSFALEGFAAPWVEALKQGRYINQTVDEFPDALRAHLAGPPSYVKSILLLPLQVRGHFSGVIGFSNCQVARAWSQSEVSMLQVAAHAFAIATERHQAEVSLHRAESKYRSIFENAVEGIFQTTTDGRYITANPMLAKIYGYESPAALMAQLTDIENQLYVNPQQRRQFVNQMMVEGAVIGFEAAVYRRDGSVIWISESARVTLDGQGDITGFEGTVEDITARKQTELELQRRDRLLQGVARASQNLLTQLDIHQSMPEVLAILGEAAVADRVYLYENHPHPKTGKISMSMRFEWTQAGIAPSINQPHWQNQSYLEHGLMRWYRAFQAGQSIRGRVCDFPKSERQLLARDKIAAILMVPIFIDRDLWGYVGFDACHQSRDWTPSEESILVTIAASIGGALKRQHTEAQMRYQAFHDPLTGLPNRTAFNQQLPLILDKARRSRTKVAVMFLDLDRFKNINDTLGHAVGDKLLVEATRRLNSGLRRDDMLARWGGDEFTLILQNLDSPTEAAAIAHRLAENLKPALFIEHHELYITGSIGIAIFPDDGADVTSLLQNADAAMYSAKADGRNTHRFYTVQLKSNASRQLLLEKHLHQALQREEFTLFYQPQVDLAKGRICRIEALIRWQSPELGSVLPNEFIPIAEEIGLILPLGEWVLKQACCQLQTWHQAGFEQLEIAVNLSARQLHQPLLADDIEQLLSAFDLPPHCLELEITETAALSNLELSIATLNRLRKLGTRIVMDDFGTGYSSLNYLKQLPFHGLKIDRSFVKDIPNDTQNMAMLKAVITLGQALQLGLIAEGVETPEQVSCLRSLGCHQMQGYWFSRPLNTAAMTTFLETHWLAYNVSVANSTDGLSR